MARWRRLSSVAGLATGIAAASAGAVIAAEKVAVGRIRLRPDPASGRAVRPAARQARGGARRRRRAAARRGLRAGDAPVTIVFCHGYTLSQEVWHYQRQGLGTDARLVVWDQRSHGRSGPQRPRARQHRPARRRPGRRARGDVPRSGPVVLVGHSMGGMTIMALAAQQPELFGQKVIGVVLISTAAHLVDAADWLPGPLRPLARWSAARRCCAARRMAGRAELTERFREPAGDLAFLSTRFIAFGDPDVSPTVVDFLERVIRATPDRCRGRLLPGAARARQAARRWPRSAGSRLIVMTGGARPADPGRQAAELAAAIPGARLVRVPDAGHMVILERPGDRDRGDRRPDGARAGRGRTSASGPQ